MASLVGYSKQTWKDGETKITADRMGHVEDGVYNCSAMADTLGIAVGGKHGGRNLATVLADEIGSGTVFAALHSRAANANWKGLLVNDYMDVATSAGTVTSQSTTRFRIAHFDPYYQCGDTAKGHHIAFVADTSVAVSSSYSGVKNGSFLPWNATNTNQGTADDKHPYTCSQLKGWETAFASCLPSGLTQHLLTQRVLLEERYSASGALTNSNSWSWCDIGKVWSLSETEVYGQRVWGTEGFSVGFDCQFDIFKDTAHRLNGSRYGWWLRSAQSGSSSGVCCVYYTGRAGCYDATFAWVRPRPGFLLG